MDIEKTKTQSALFTAKGETGRIATATMLADLEEYRRMLDIQAAWRRALPALVRVVDLNRDGMMARLFMAISAEPQERMLAVQDLTRALEDIQALVKPRHDQGWANADDRPSVAISALLRMVRDVVELKLPTRKAEAEVALIATPRSIAEKTRSTKRRGKKKRARKTPTIEGLPTGKRGFFRYTDAQVREVRRLGKKLSGVAIADKLGMSISYVRGILSGAVRSEVTA